MRYPGRDVGAVGERGDASALHRDFPPPRWELAMGNIWWADDVEAWIRERRPELAEDPETD